MSSWPKRIAAAIAAIALIAVLMLQTGCSGGAAQSAGIRKVVAEYPAPTAPTLSAAAYMVSRDHTIWRNAFLKRIEQSKSLQGDMTAYNRALMKNLLPSEHENTVCSPLNTYIAFAMLAEVSGGDTRQQLLDMLDVPDIDTLRARVSALWNSNYADTPVLKSVLANSLWLSDRVTYNEDTLKRLAEQYYASSFSGEMGSDALNQAVRAWTDDNTGGLLHDETAAMELDKNTVLELISTLYFKAAWKDPFTAGASTAPATFHGTRGDVTVNMMHQIADMKVYLGSRMKMAGLPLVEGGTMFFILPEEHVDINTLANSAAVMDVLQRDADGETGAFTQVDFSLPKFHVSARSDLRDVMKALGATDALDPGTAEFTPLTDGLASLYVSRADHAAVLEVDEQGVLGAAYTDIGITYKGVPTPSTELVLDRPFMFVVTGADGMILFAGIVRNL